MPKNKSNKKNKSKEESASDSETDEQWKKSGKKKDTMKESKDLWKKSKRKSTTEEPVWKEKKSKTDKVKSKKSRIKKSETVSDEQLFEQIQKGVFVEENIKNKKQTCEGCGGEQIVNDSKQGNRVCVDCGVVLESIIDETSDTRQYNNEDGGGDSGGNRCGGPINYFLPSSSIGTSIVAPNYSKIKKIHNQVAMPYHERSLHEVLKELESICQKNNIKKNVLDEAQILYKQVHETKHKDGARNGKYEIHRGGTRRGLKAACLYEALRKRGKPHSHSEVAKMFGYKLTQVRIGCRLLGNILDKPMEKGSLFDKEQYFKSSDPNDFIERFCQKYKKGKNFIPHIKQIINNSNKLGIATEHTPQSITAASILIVGEMERLKIDKKEIAELFDLAEVTVTKPYAKMEQYKDILVDDKLVKKACKIIRKEKKKQKNLQLDIVTDDEDSS